MLTLLQYLSFFCITALFTLDANVSLEPPAAQDRVAHMQGKREREREREKWVQLFERNASWFVTAERLRCRQKRVIVWRLASVNLRPATEPWGSMVLTARSLITTSISLSLHRGCAHDRCRLITIIWNSLCIHYPSPGALHTTQGIWNLYFHISLPQRWRKWGRWC